MDQAGRLEKGMQASVRWSSIRIVVCETFWSPCSLKTDTPKHSPTSCQLLSELLNALTVECETHSCPVHSVPSKILCTQV